MKQLLTRIDDELHARLKARAEREGRSLNDLVTEALHELAPPLSEEQRALAKLEAAGMLVKVEPSGAATGRDGVFAVRTGGAVSAELARDRRAR